MATINKLFDKVPPLLESLSLSFQGRRLFIYSRKGVRAENYLSACTSTRLSPAKSPRLERLCGLGRAAHGAPSLRAALTGRAAPSVRGQRRHSCPRRRRENRGCVPAARPRTGHFGRPPAPRPRPARRHRESGPAAPSSLRPQSPSASAAKGAAPGSSRPSALHVGSERLCAARSRRPPPGPRSRRSTASCGAAPAAAHSRAYSRPSCSMAARAAPEPLPRNRSPPARAPARRAPGRRARPRAGHGGAGRLRRRLQEGAAAPGAAPSGGRGPGPAHPFLSPQDTVDRLLRLHFRDGRTRGTGAAAAAGGSGRAPASRNRLVLAVNADAQLLMAELLKVFVRGERAGPPQPWRAPGSSRHPAALRLLPSSPDPACEALRYPGPPPSSQHSGPGSRTERPRCDSSRTPLTAFLSLRCRSSGSGSSAGPGRGPEQGGY